MRPITLKDFIESGKYWILDSTFSVTFVTLVADHTVILLGCHPEDAPSFVPDERRFNATLPVRDGQVLALAGVVLCEVRIPGDDLGDPPYVTVVISGYVLNCKDFPLVRMDRESEAETTPRNGVPETIVTGYLQKSTYRL